MRFERPSRNPSFPRIDPTRRATPRSTRARRETTVDISPHRFHASRVARARRTSDARRSLTAHLRTAPLSPARHSPSARDATRRRAVAPMRYVKPKIATLHAAAAARELLESGACAGKTVVVTGASSGIGRAFALTCARSGAALVVTLDRPSARANEAREALRCACEEGGAEFRGVDCDLTSLASARRASAEVLAIVNARAEGGGGTIDVLALNAGIMAAPFEATEDGYDQQVQTNVLSHFLLTKLLAPALGRAKDARVISQSSLAAKQGRWLRRETFEKAPTCWEPFSWPYARNAWAVYAQTKLANLAFTEGLRQRLDAAGITNVKAIACHPGVAATELQVRTSENPGPLGSLVGIVPYFIKFQSAEDGALPLLRAAFGADVKSGDFIVPSGWFQITGPPKTIPIRSWSYATAYLTDAGVSLAWTACERAVGERFDVRAEIRSR